LADRYRAADGWVVDVITLSLTSGNRDGTWLRICRHGYHVADVRTIEELADYVPLEGLEPALELSFACSRQQGTKHPGLRRALVAAI
jgi:hypothetical protein